MRKSTVALGALGIGAVVLLLWLALREEPVPEAPPSEEPSTGTLDPTAARRISHEGWPFGEFAADIGALKSPEPGGTAFVPDVKRNENEREVYFTNFSMNLVDVHPKQVVEELARIFKDAGVKIFTLDPPVPDHVRVTVAGDELTIPKVLDQLRMQTNEECRYIMTWQGLCIGTEHAIEEAQLQANAAAGARKAMDDPPTTILDVEYRPGLEGAWIGAIVRDIRAQTGVEVVVDSDLWVNPKTLKWRARPMPLRAALDKICDEFGAYHRVRDGRVYLLKP